MDKYFKYCESTDGGMQDFDVTSKDCLSSLYGWMHSLCKAEDNNLVKFMESAKIGDYHEHRLGILFCINAPTGEKKINYET